MKRIPFNARETDLERIAIIKALYPNPQNTTQAIRLALLAYINNADPVQLEAARKAARKAAIDKAIMSGTRIGQARKAQKKEAQR